MGPDGLAAVNCCKVVICIRVNTQLFKCYHMLLWHADGMLAIGSILQPCAYTTDLSLQRPYLTETRPDHLTKSEPGCTHCVHHIAVSLDGIFFSALHTI